VGNAIVQHPLVKKISFTGGTSTGRQLAHIAAERLIGTSLELGGKSPTVVLEDADLDLAVNGVIYGIFSSSGQACIAGARLFVHANVYEAFMQRLVAKTQALRVGHPEHAATQVGPLIDEKHLNSVNSI
jgi:acyl-CoA reductase-like NAD-dependent aldehyde dehydrogenase